MTEALNHPADRPQAAEALRSLIEKLVLTAGAQRGGIFAT